MTIEAALNEEIEILRADAATMQSEIERLTTALTTANAKIDELKKAGDELNRSWWDEHTERIQSDARLSLAQSEIKSLRSLLDIVGEFVTDHDGHSKAVAAWATNQVTE